MTTASKLAAINEFLDAVYGPGTRLSTLLSAAGCTPEQLSILRKRHLDQLIDAFIASVTDRFAAYSGGERKVTVLVRRFGLHGQPRATLAAIGRDMGLSRERVRQIEDSALRRCRFEKNRRLWQGTLYQMAITLLAADNASPPSPASLRPATETARPPSPPAATAAKDQNTAVGVSSIGTIARIDEDMLARVEATVAAIDAAVGAPVRPTTIAHILHGRSGPIVRALVGYYHLEFAFGTFAAFDLHILTVLVRRARRLASEAQATPTAAAASRARGSSAAEDVHDADRAIDPVLLASVREMSGAIEATLGYHLWGVMLAHILTGSLGPKVAALVSEHNLPYYGALKDEGFRAVRAAVHMIRSEPPEGEAAPHSMWQAALLDATTAGGGADDDRAPAASGPAWDQIS